MATSARYDTTCPSCNQTFEVDETLTEGDCPFCSVHLRFLEEAPPPPPDMPALGPGPTPPAPEPAAAAVASTNGDGGHAVACPRCSASFTVGHDATEGACPQCGSALRFDDEYPHAIEAFTIRCPSCGATSDVAADATSAQCPHCGSSLRLDDVFPGQEALIESRPPLVPAPVATPAPEPEADPTRGRFRRFTRRPEPVPQAPAEPVAPAMEEPAAGPDLPPPVKGAPPSGLPYVLSCPTCKKEFSVGPKEHEGNCPHCNAPLAFLTEKEYEALLEAEERKRAFQAKMQEKRLERKKREEERLARETATAPERPKLLSKLRRAKTPAEPAPPAEPRPASTPEPATPAVEEPKRRRWAPTFPWKPKKAEPEAAAGTPAVPEPIPVAQEPARKPKKGKAEAAPAAAVIESQEPVVEAPVAPLPKRGKGKKDAAPPPAPAALVESDLSIGDVVEAAPATATEAPAKRGFLSRFRKPKAPGAAPAASVEPAGIEMGGVELASTPPPAAPEPPKKRKGKAAAPPPATAPEATIEFESSVEAPAASAAPTPKKGLLARLRREKPPPGPAAVVETGDVEFANGAPGATIESPSLEVSAKPKAAPRKRRK
jgi:DNA-directed RNA polymerase subunit RPC12/RpoP